MAQDADIIIVGAGTAGCVLANRLAAAQAGQVVLLESGGSDRSPLISAPGGIWPIMRSGAFSFHYRTAPQPHLNGRSFHMTRGKVLGGSSSTNGMVYSRGSSDDFARWQSQGLADWSYEQVLPWFRELETHPLGPSRFHGASGPVRISRPGVQHPLSKALLAAATQRGFALNDDTDGASREGFGPLDLMAWQGRRWSTSVAYLRPVLQRRNLHVVRNAHAVRILFKERRACGVEYRRDGRLHCIRAAQVIISCGAIESPHLLMLSGIGAAEALQPFNIPVVCPLPGVGLGLQDHVAVSLKCRINQPLTLLRYRDPWRMAQALADYLLRRRGPLANPGFEVVGFVKSRPELSQPDLRLQLVLALMQRDGQRMLPVHGFQIRASLARPVSQGSVRLVSPDPMTAPLIDQNYLSTTEERVALRQAVRIMRGLWTAPAFDPYRGEELSPGPGCESDTAIDLFVRENADPDYHSVGTCRMGNDATAVVDEQFRVRGVEGLRVVDASIMPGVTDAGTCIPTIMIAERAAKAILDGL